MNILKLVVMFIFLASCVTNEGNITINANKINNTTSTDNSSTPEDSNPTSNESTTPTENTYVPLTCPTGYVSAKGSESLAVESFCVMKYEASITGSNVFSSETSAPAQFISPALAKSYCTSITDVNFNGTFDLISNPEWMALANEIENDARNWSGQTVGDGCLFRGNNGTDDACGYNGSDPEYGSNRNVKARHFLESDEEIWDLAGNLWEMVDYTLGGSLDPAPSTCGSAIWYELTNLATTCPLLNETDYMPSTTPYGTTYGHGSFFGGYFTAPGSYVTRSGHYGHGTNTGVYTLSTYFALNDAWSPQGFRCVYRP